MITDNRTRVLHNSFSDTMSGDIFGSNDALRAALIFLNKWKCSVNNLVTHF